MAANNRTILNCFLGDYDGRGEWVDMTQDIEDIQKIVDKYTRNGQRDLLISDYSSSYIPTHLDIDYMSVNDVIELAQTIQSLVNSYESINIVRAIIGAADAFRSGSESIAEFIENNDFYIYENCASMADVAMQVIEEGGRMDELPEWARDYFDYEKYGRDLEIEGQFHYGGNDIYVEIGG